MSFTTRYSLCIAAWLILLLSVGYWAERHLTGVDAGLYSAAGRLLRNWPAGDYAQLHRPGSPVLQEDIVLKRPVRHCPPVPYIAWETGAGEDASYTAPLPKQQELATLLHCLTSKLGVRSVAISTPLSWEDEQGEMAGQMLRRALTEYQHVAVGIAGRNAAQAQNTPELLHAAVIPAVQVSGDISALPAANTPLPYSLPDEPTLLAAPDYMEDENLIENDHTRGLSQPLLLRWNGQVLAALPLRLALVELGLTPADVHARLGKSLRLGERILPLDAHGRTPLGGAQTLPLALEDVLTAYIPLPEPAQHCAVLCRPFSPGPINARAARLAATLSQLLSTGGEQLIPAERPAGGHLMEHALVHTSLTGRLGVSLLFFSLLLLLPRLKQPWRRTALLAMPAILIAAASLCAMAGAWLSLCAWLLCWALLILATHCLAPFHRRHEPTLW